MMDQGLIQGYACPPLDTHASYSMARVLRAVLEVEFAPDQMRLFGHLLESGAGARRQGRRNV